MSDIILDPYYKKKNFFKKIYEGAEAAAKAAYSPGRFPDQFPDPTQIKKGQL